MIIGILTLPFHTNYGGIMQAYALQKVLERMGHHSYVLNIYYWGNKKHSLLLLYLLKKYFSLRCFFSGKYRERRKINHFVSNKIKQKSYYTFSDISEKDFDTIIVGSDQIWREIFIPHIENVFLDFTTGWNIRRVSYATSFGTDIWSYSKDQTRNCSFLLSKFDAVSVRELSAVKLINENMGIKAELVLDPTLLLLAEDYCKMLKLHRNDNEGYMLSYILNETEQANLISKAISEEKKLDNHCLYPERHYVKTLPSIEEWLQALFNSDFVFTDSFHVSVFSIIFRKPFLFLKNEIAGNTRIESLFSVLGLQNHIISESSDIVSAVELSKLIESIDGSVETNLNELRNYSMNYLKKSLK